MLRALFRTFGARGIARRGLHEIRVRTNLYRAIPKYSDLPNSRHLGARPSIRRDPLSFPEARIGEALRRGHLVANGSYEAYGHRWRPVPCGPREWRTHPDSGFEFPLCQWWRINTLPAGEDIKDVWEPARFGWVYDLIRAYAVSGDVCFSDTFYRRLSDWMAANPAFTGVHWVCGQEVGIRALAVIHALEELPLPTIDGEAAQRRILKLLGLSGERIADAIGYGLSQRNNHGLSESAALVHIGLQLDGVHPDAQTWLRRGLQYLEEQIRDQFSADGWYAQHSFTYLRIALEQTLVVQDILRKRSMSLSPQALDVLRASVRLLTVVIDAGSGHVPNHGANDGGRAVPLSTAEYGDFRPILTQAAVILDLPLPKDIIPDPEIVWWYGGRTPAVEPGRGDGVWAGPSGWAAARVTDTFVFLRAGSYRHRPSHLDALHLDVRFRDCDTIVDPGTYAYNAPAPWKNSLTSATVHNGPILDANEPAVRGPRFLWLSWPFARLLSWSYADNRAKLSAELPHRVKREIEVTPCEVRVSDTSLDADASEMRVTWLLGPNASAGQVIAANGKCDVICAEEGSVTGWYSPTYGLRIRSTAVRVRAARTGSILRLATSIRGRV
jgi:hypothetical protein